MATIRNDISSGIIIIAVVTVMMTVYLQPTCGLIAAESDGQRRCGGTAFGPEFGPWGRGPRSI